MHSLRYILCCNYLSKMHEKVRIFDWLILYVRRYLHVTVFSVHLVQMLKFASCALFYSDDNFVVSNIYLDTLM